MIRPEALPTYVALASTSIATYLWEDKNFLHRDFLGDEFLSIVCLENHMDIENVPAWSLQKYILRIIFSLQLRHITCRQNCSAMWTCSSWMLQTSTQTVPISAICVGKDRMCQNCGEVPYGRRHACDFWESRDQGYSSIRSGRCWQVCNRSVDWGFHNFYLIHFSSLILGHKLPQDLRLYWGWGQLQFECLKMWPPT